MQNIRKNIVRQGQTFIDKVLECTGDLEQSVLMSVLNGKSISDALNIGEELQTTDVVKKSVVALWNGEGPATEKVYTNEQELPLEGIDYMGIEIDFTVN